ncbi:MAG: hypothetical protein NC123_10760 [Butyrivibrio sp.]|nr:hypothetical protein [Acetatifactor muris]MCM1560009.1 hypothetical protein [Butyrivibrio sp.]
MEPLKLDDSSYSKMWEKAAGRLQEQADWWSHRGLSDPGVTLLELWAVLCDMQSFYLDQVQESHYRGYLKLLGREPDQGSCARAWVLFQEVAEDCVLPAGTKLLANALIYEIPETTELTGNVICELFRGADNYRVSAMLLSRKYSLELKRSEVLFSFWLKKPLRAGQRVWFYVLLEKREQSNPPAPGFSQVRLAWEYKTAHGWREARTLKDETYGLLCSGGICLETDRPMEAGEGGCKIRCRVVEGEYDKMPTLFKISLNAVEAVQKSTLCCQEYGAFSRACGRAELQSYLGKTGEIRVFAGQGDGFWKEITDKCRIEPPVTAEGQSRYVYFQGEARVKFVCSAAGFAEEYGPCPVTGVTGQRILLPWKNVLRDSAELMLAQGEEGLYREYRRTEPEEIRFPNAWHWGEEENEIVLGDGRHGDIPEASERGLLLTSLALFEGERGDVSIGRIRQLERPELFPKMSCSNPMSGGGGRNRKRPSEQFRELAGGLAGLNRIVTEEDAKELAGKTPGLLVRNTEAKWKDNKLVVTVTPRVSLKECCREQYRNAVERYLEQYRPAGIAIRVEIA